MMPGPDQVLACPSCGNLMRQMTLLSGNAFGGTLWSDGYAEYPMLPRIPDISRCASCAALFWVDEAREIGSFEPWSDEGSEWSEAPRLEPLGTADLERAIESGMGSDGRELGLRMQLWWSRNAGARNGGSPPGDPAFLRNLEAIRKLVDAGEESGRLLTAETLREAGEFEAARLLLESPFGSELQSVADAIGQTLDVRESRVFPLS